MTLAKCPCGETPDTLWVEEGSTCSWAWVSGNCCGFWSIKFRTDYRELGTDELMKLATAAWNEAPRKGNS